MVERSFVPFERSIISLLFGSVRSISLQIVHLFFIFGLSACWLVFRNTHNIFHISTRLILIVYNIAVFRANIAHVRFFCNFAGAFN